MKKLILRSLHQALIFTSCLLLSYASLHGQNPLSLDPIFVAYEKGHHQSFRDVLSLLVIQNDEATMQRIKKGTLIDFQDPELGIASPESWLKYYYQHHDQIQYYPEWRMFLRNDLPIPNLSYAILESHEEPSTLILKARKIYNIINEKSLNKLVPLVQSLTLPETIHSKRILLESLENLVQTLSCEKMILPYAAIVSKLITINDQFIHRKIDKILSTASCSPKVHKDIIAQILKYKSSSLLYKDDGKLLSEYRNSQFITYLKTNKYSEALNISSSYFDNKVDHYGKLLSALPKENYIDEEEIINILIESESPKSIFYIISRWFIYAKDNHPRASALMQIITAFIDHNIQINTPDGHAFKVSQNTNSLVVQKGILSFWLNNYKHYEWNEDIAKFININLLKQDRQKLIHLYKNLNSSNTQLALKSYWKLVQCDPSLLVEVDKVYSKKLLNYNSNLPSRKYKYLLQLARLVQYCKTNSIEYRIQSDLSHILHELQNANDISEIIKLENKIIALLNFENITAFEIWAIVNSGMQHIQYSATKISNIFYNTYINEIFSSDRIFKLFLKKANLFKNFGDHGSSKYYLQKILDHPKLDLNQLKDIKNKTLDRDILSSIEYIENYKSESIASTKSIDFNKFIESPSAFQHEELKHITKFTKHILSKVANTFKHKYSPRDQFIILEWIKIHTPKELLPLVVSLNSEEFNLISNQNIEVPVQEFARYILSIYISNDNNTSEKWPKGYYKLFKNLFNEDLDQIAHSDEIEIETINNIINSKFYTSEARSIVLHGLTKVKPVRNIISCELPQKLSLEELKFLIPKIQSKNALEYLLKITDVKRNDDLMSFLIDYMTAKGSTMAGRFFNDMFKKQWFTEYIDSDSTSADLKMKIQWILTDYWENESALSSFEEEQTVLNIIKVELAGKSLKERLDLILASFVDNEVKKQTIQKIIHQIDYESIPILLAYYDQIKQIGGLQLFQFITTDFGIPMEDLSDRNNMFQLASDIHKLSEKEVYLKYLNRIGIYLNNNSNKFDVNKAYKIITEDLVRPFVGSGGSVRDIYVFGTIKLLEMEFGKDLGFHPKLNESQSFYKYTSKKRAQAWAEELSDLVRSD